MRYRFGEFELDPGSYRLCRQGEAVRLEPRLLEMLAYLVERRVRMVPKEELFAEVWKGQAVTDAVLTRAAYELRRALDDDSRQQHLLKTVHGRGYQFVGEVEELGTGQEAAGGPPELPSIALPEETPAPAAASGAPETAARPADLEDPEPLPGEGARPRWPGGRRLAVAAVALLALAGGWALVRSWPRTEAPAPSGAPPPANSRERGAPGPRLVRLALVPFATAGGDAVAELAALSVADLLWTRLNEQPGILVRTPEFSAEPSLGAGSLSELARQLEVGALLTGSIQTVAGSPRLELAVVLHDTSALPRVEAIPIGRYELPALSEDRGLTAFTRAREAIARDVARHLGAALALPSQESLDPHHAEAYRLYLLARQRMARLTCGEGGGVIDLLDRSLELDPTFALAWTLQGFVHYSQVWSCGREGAYAANALAAVERALELEPELSVALFLKTLLLTDTGRVEEAYTFAREAHGKRPLDPSILFGQSYALRYAGQLERSDRALRRALALDPLLLHEVGETPTSLLYQGRHEEYLALLPASDTPYHRFYRGLAETIRGRREEAREVLAPAFRLNPNDLFARLSAALLEVLDGNRREGAEIVRQVARQRRALGTPDGEMTFKEAQLLALAGQEEEALGQLALAVEQGFFCPTCLEADPFLAPYASRPRFREVLARATVRHRAFAERFGFTAPSGKHP